VLVSCELSANGQRITCQMSTTQSTTARLLGSVRVAGTQIKAAKAGKKGKVTVRVKAKRGKRFNRSSRVVVRAKIGKSTARMTVRVGKRIKLAF
jgi:hypothetical protein